MSSSSSSSSRSRSRSRSRSNDPFAGTYYGDLPLKLRPRDTAVDLNAGTRVKDLNANLKNKEILTSGRFQSVRLLGKNKASFVVTDMGFAVRCIVAAQHMATVDRHMLNYVGGLTEGSIVQVQGVVSVPSSVTKASKQQVEIQVRKVFCVSRAVEKQPITTENAPRSEKENEEPLKATERHRDVNQEVMLAPLDYRALDRRTPVNHAIVRVLSEVISVFRGFLLSEDFIEINTPQMLSGSIEESAAVFGQPACLGESQLRKQMAIAGDFERVFEIGPVYMKGYSVTHEHVCESTYLNVEMEMKRHYFEVMDIVDRLFVSIFDRLDEKFKSYLECGAMQCPFEPLKYLRKTLRLRFEEGIQMLKDAGVEVDPYGDLKTEAKSKLGQLVLEKYETEFYILHRCPLAGRPFFTMPCYDDPKYSNSFDVFMRGEEIISGAQHIHMTDLLEERAQACGIDVSTIANYIDMFRCAMPPHGGFGARLERIVTLYCGLPKSCLTSLFDLTHGDPRRLGP